MRALYRPHRHLHGRLLSVDDGKVQFRWKEYRYGSQQKAMNLDADEFIRRFLIHVLPDGFRRIRYYGLLSNAHRAGQRRYTANCSPCNLSPRLRPA
jgi:hypothetical protein